MLDMTAAAPISYDVPGAAAAVGISKTTVWRLIASGDLVTFKLGARTLIRADVLQAYIDRISSREAA
ncbi:helix-turn-helix domain-containing protein [uncultured Brevundimonas sp.]|uniref:helix-turn-helix domain-containing protein n=1 Tax=uncultured Brevundimonas sp. TaxID=213418 RepID=UPI0025D45892|nr:helix-turn-helix domain-containing protein [uncultured Brevundimonas sp.]